MSSVRQLTQRAREQFVKPAFPDGPFMLIDYATRLDEGPFYAEWLRQSEFPGKPWAFSGMGGSNIALRITKQRGDVLFREDGGRWKIVALTPSDFAREEP